MADRDLGRFPVTMHREYLEVEQRLRAAFMSGNEDEQLIIADLLASAKKIPQEPDQDLLPARAAIRWLEQGKGKGTKPEEKHALGRMALMIWHATGDKRYWYMAFALTKQYPAKAEEFITDLGKIDREPPSDRFQQALSLVTDIWNGNNTLWLPVVILYRDARVAVAEDLARKVVKVINREKHPNDAAYAESLMFGITGDDAYRASAHERMTELLHASDDASQEQAAEISSHIALAYWMQNRIAEAMTEVESIKLPHWRRRTTLELSGRIGSLSAWRETKKLPKGESPWNWQEIEESTLNAILALKIEKDEAYTDMLRLFRDPAERMIALSRLLGFEEGPRTRRDLVDELWSIFSYEFLKSSSFSSRQEEALYCFVKALTQRKCPESQVFCILDKLREDIAVRVQSHFIRCNIFCTILVHRDKHKKCCENDD